MSKKVLLAILDGWGIGNKTKSDAIYQANTPCMDNLLNVYPNATLNTSGEDVGLPKGQMGNSEVGHLNIGAGRIVYQELTRISKSIHEGDFFKNHVLINAFQYAEKNHVNVHFMGLFSDGGVHSHMEHLYALIDMSRLYSLKGVYIHAFLDGRDTDPKSGYNYIKQYLELEHPMDNFRLATIIGRYYAMDRDNRWERIQKAYNLLVNRSGTQTHNFLNSIQEHYDKGITDEFMEPLYNAELSDTSIKPNDVVICFNFRTDRCREITKALTQKDMPEYNMKKIPLHYVTMTKYDDTFDNIQVVFEKDTLQNTLGDVLQQHEKCQVRIAETEKYPHVTFFFSGGRENPFRLEKRILINSPKVATYDLMPQMSAYEVTEHVLIEIQNNKPDFICLNFANADMVGHTGVYDAIIKAVETVDECLCKILQEAKKNEYSIVIIADHGNADIAINSDGSPNTAHTTNPVPIIVIDKDTKLVKNGILADIAPSILKLMSLPQPKEMTGNIIIA